MVLKLFNTVSREVEEFKPREEGKVSLYTCGPTIYDYAHIGNFRAYVCGDLLRRYLEYKGFDVRHVMNLTDVDDKTIKNSIAQGVSLKEYTDTFKEAFFEDLDILNIERAHVFPEATEHIEEMIAIIKNLMDKGIAYKGDDGCIYYDVTKFPEYGKLAHIKLDELKAGARVKQDEYQKDQAQDFALWKAWDEDDGDVFWETELGKGRPGWHIECSAMSMKHLGESFDIHGGGIDLVFPHHENEIAQSEGSTGKPFVNYWFHNEWLKVDGKKMSKSLGNFYTLRDLLEKGYKPLAIRYLLLSTGYRQQLNFTLEGVEAAQNSLQRLYDLAIKLDEVDGSGDGVDSLIAEARSKFEEAMDNDLNISEGLSHIFELVTKVNSLIAENKVSKEDASKLKELFCSLDKVLGVFKEDEDVPQEILDLVEQREQARANKDYAESDRLRDEISSKGYVIEDTPNGARVKKK